MKSAPPQQTSLNVMWKKKKQQPSPDPTKMEVSSDEETKPVASTSGTLHPLYKQSKFIYRTARPKAKRKSSIPEPDEGEIGSRPISCSNLRVKR
jgi:hypothetical protein